MTKVQIYRFDWVPTQVEVDQEDLISISEAARVRGVTIASIANAMSMGDLPTFQFATEIAGVRIQRFTSRKAVEALPKVRKGSDSEATSQATQYKGYYLAPLCPVIETASLSPAPVDGPLLPVLN